MRIRYWLVLAFVLFSPLAVHANSPVLAGVGANPTAGNSDSTQANEPPVITPRFDGSTLDIYNYLQYDSVPIMLGPIGPTASVSVATKTIVGARTWIGYTLPQNTPQIAVEQYYQSLIQKAGGGIAYSCDNASCGTNNMSASDTCQAFGKRYSPGIAFTGAPSYLFPDGNPSSPECHYFVGFIPASGSDGDIYVSVFVYDIPSLSDTKGPNALIDVVEASNFAVKTVHLDADKMASDISATGKVDIYGIYFDTDKSDLKPESTDAIQQIAKLLGDQPNLHVLIVGNTDNQGDFQYNIGLSMRRAQAVIQALVTQYHIDPSRLTPFGDGMTAPVATNDTDAGRALNRRVELVKE